MTPSASKLSPAAAADAQRVLDAAARRILAENLAAKRPRRRVKARA